MSSQPLELKGPASGGYTALQAHDWHLYWGGGGAYFRSAESEHCKASWSAGARDIGIDRVKELAGSASWRPGGFVDGFEVIEALAEVEYARGR